MTMRIIAKRVQPLLKWEMKQLNKSCWTKAVQKVDELSILSKQNTNENNALLIWLKYVFSLKRRRVQDLETEKWNLFSNIIARSGTML